MIRAEFRLRGGKPQTAAVSGHAGWAEPGQDILCASVTSAVQLCANGITEVLGVRAGVTVAGPEQDSQIAITLPGDAPDAAAAFLEALRLHLGLLAQDYPDHIQLTALEV